MFLAGLITGGVIGFVLGVTVAGAVWAMRPDKRPYLAVVQEQRRTTDVQHHHWVRPDRWVEPQPHRIRGDRWVEPQDPVRLIDTGDAPGTDSNRLLES